MYSVVFENTMCWLLLKVLESPRIWWNWCIVGKKHETQNQRRECCEKVKKCLSGEVTFEKWMDSRKDCTEGLFECPNMTVNKHKGLEKMCALWWRIHSKEEVWKVACSNSYNSAFPLLVNCERNLKVGVLTHNIIEVSWKKKLKKKLADV